MAHITLPPMRHLIGHPFVQNIAILGSGTAIAQAVNIAATPLLAALYGPDSFGVMAIFMGLILVAGSMASLTYESAIVLSREHDEAEALIALCVTIVSVVTVIVFAALAGYYLTSSDPGMAMDAGLLVLVPLGVFFLGVFNVASNWMTRLEAFKAISAANVVRSVGGTAAQLVLSVFGGGSLGLIFGRIFGQAAATVYLLVRGRLIAHRFWFRSPQTFRAVVRRYYRFPVYRAPQAAIVHIADQAPAFALGFFFGPAYAGLYWIAHRILSLPCTILTESTAKVYYAEATKRHQNRDSLMPLLLKTVAGLASVAFLPSIILAFFAPDLLSVLGSEWQPAGVYVQWMTLWLFFRFSCSPVMATYMILDNQKALLVIDSIAMMVRFPSIVLAGTFGNPLLLVIMLSVFESLKIIVTVFHILFCLHVRTPKNAGAV